MHYPLDINHLFWVVDHLRACIWVVCFSMACNSAPFKENHHIFNSIGFGGFIEAQQIFFPFIYIFLLGEVYTEENHKGRLSMRKKDEKRQCLACSTWPLSTSLIPESHLCPSLRGTPTALHFLTNYELSPYCK